MLQGKSMPRQVLDLKQSVEMHGDMLMENYFAALGSIMYCCSRFMDEESERIVPLGIGCLLHLDMSSLASIYWCYMYTRARRLSSPRIHRSNLTSSVRAVSSGLAL